MSSGTIFRRRPCPTLPYPILSPSYTLSYPPNTLSQFYYTRVQVDTTSLQSRAVAQKQDFQAGTRKSSGHILTQSAFITIKIQAGMSNQHSESAL